MSTMMRDPLVLTTLMVRHANRCGLAKPPQAWAWQDRCARLQPDNHIVTMIEEGGKLAYRVITFAVRTRVVDL